MRGSKQTPGDLTWVFVVDRSDFLAVVPEQMLIESPVATRDYASSSVNQLKFRRIVHVLSNTGSGELENFLLTVITKARTQKKRTFDGIVLPGTPFVPKQCPRRGASVT